MGASPPGFPNLVWITTDNNDSMPRLRLDVYESSYERRQVESVRKSLNLAIPFNTTSNTAAILVSSMTPTGAPESFSFRITIPKMDKTLWQTAGTLTAELQTLPTGESYWETIATQSTTGSSSQSSEGFQIVYENNNENHAIFRLQLVNTGGSLAMATNATAFIDGIYTGNQRRRVENLVASQTTNHISTLSTQFSTLIAATTLTNPILYVAENTVDGSEEAATTETPASIHFNSRPMRQFRFVGEWKIDRISAERGEGRSAEILLSLTKEGAWSDE